MVIEEGARVSMIILSGTEPISPRNAQESNSLRKISFQNSFHRVPGNFLIFSRHISLPSFFLFRFLLPTKSIHFSFSFFFLFFHTHTHTRIEFFNQVVEVIRPTLGGRIVVPRDTFHLVTIPAGNRISLSLSPCLNYELFRGCFHRSITLKTSRRSFVEQFHASRSKMRRGKREIEEIIRRNQGFL